MNSSWYRGEVTIQHPLSVRVHFWRNRQKNPNHDGWKGVLWAYPFHEYRRGFEAWIHYQKDLPQGCWEKLDPYAYGERHVTSRKHRRRLIKKLVRGPISKVLGEYQGVKICTTCGVFVPESHAGEDWRWWAQFWDGGTHRLKEPLKLTARELERLLVLKKAGAVRLTDRGLPKQSHRRPEEE
jgi:hypothetical protein